MTKEDVKLNCPQKVRTCPKCKQKFIKLTVDAKNWHEYLWDSLHEYEQQFLLTAGPVEVEKGRHKKHKCNRRQK